MYRLRCWPLSFYQKLLDRKEIMFRLKVLTLNYWGSKLFSKSRQVQILEWSILKEILKLKIINRQSDTSSIKGPKSLHMKMYFELLLKKLYDHLKEAL